MFKNKNYEWMKDYETPGHRDYICGITKYLYWMFMYYKLCYQGTQEDKLRLAVLYDDAVENEVSVGSSLDRDMSHYYEIASRTFIYETKKAANFDDIERDNRIKKADRERKQKELRNKIAGYDVEAKEVADRMYELELDEEGKNDPERNEIIKDGLFAKYPTIEKATTKKCIYTETIPVQTARAGVINVHVRAYDRCNSYFFAAVWCDERPVDENGCQTCVPIYRRHLYGSDGLYAVIKHKVSLEKIAILQDNFNNPPKSKKQKAIKEDDIDISKVTKALGIDDDDDDMDTEIF